MTNSTTREKVNICASKHELYKQLTDGDSAPFKTMKDLFLAAAAMGVRKSIREPLAKRLSVFSWGQFSLQEDVPFIHALLIASGESVEVLLDQPAMLDKLEEYANAGIEDVAEDLIASAKPVLKWINKVLVHSQSGTE